MSFRIHIRNFTIFHVNKTFNSIQTKEHKVVNIMLQWKETLLDKKKRK